jgi:hypothetical protein
MVRRSRRRTATADGVRVWSNDGERTRQKPESAGERREGARRRISPRGHAISDGAVAHPGPDRAILPRLRRTRFASHAHHDRVLHRLKLRAPGRQVGGRARAAVSRGEGRASPGRRWTIRGIEGRLTDLPEVEARTTCGAGRDRRFVASGRLIAASAASDPGRCVVWTRWPVARRTPRNPSIISHRCALQSPPAAATPRV